MHLHFIEINNFYVVYIFDQLLTMDDEIDQSKIN